MMKKTVAALLIGGIMGGNTLSARDDVSQSQPFIGLELGYATVQGDVGIDGVYADPNNIIRDYKGSDLEYGIRIGAQKEEWRVMLSFNYFDSNDDGKKQNYEKGLASIDYFFLNGKSNTVKPFIGGNMGYVNYESDNNIDMSGFIYGAQAGMVISITDTIDLDLMYRYSLSNATQDDRDAALDHIGSIVFGINYVY